jgi:hypothetical protein
LIPIRRGRAANFRGDLTWHLMINDDAARFVVRMHFPDHGRREEA